MTGIFCDDCAPGYDSEFPACKECHPCNAIWAEDVTDVQRASQVLKQLIPRIGEVTQPAHERLLLELRSKLDGLGRLTALAPPALEGVEELYEAIRLVRRPLASLGPARPRGVMALLSPGTPTTPSTRTGAWPTRLPSTTTSANLAGRPRTC